MFLITLFCNIHVILSLYVKSIFMKIFTCFIICFHFIVVAQDKYPYNKWTSQEYSWASSSNVVGYMDSTEKEIIFLCNLVRINPKLFRSTYLQEYIDLNGLDDKNYYVSSLIKTLEEIKPTHILKPDSNLFLMARYHAVKMGEKGKVGHYDFESRCKKFLKGKFVIVGENCSYGSFDAIDIFMDLLIDEGISDLGHRENILKKVYNCIGVSIQSHKTYQINCVLDFGCDKVRIKEKPLIYKILFWIK